MQVIKTLVAGEVRHYQMLIGGEWVAARSGHTFDSINPYNGKTWATFPEADETDVDAAVRAARDAFDNGPWGRMTGTERARLMRRFADVLAANADQIGGGGKHRQRQTHPRDAEPTQFAPRMVLLFRGRGG